MSESLQKKRARLLAQIGQIQRIRRGQLSEQYYEKEDAQGRRSRRGPYFVWQAWIKGKKRSIRVKREEAEQVREDIEAYKRYRELCDQLADVTEMLTRQGPVAGSKKKVQEVREAIGEELSSFLSVAEQRLAKDGVSRLDWLEVGLRDMFLTAGSRIIEALLSDRELAIDGDQRLKGERCLKDQGRVIDTLFGAVSITRHGYYDAQVGSSRYPLDEALQLVDGFTPASAKLICRFASREPYQVASTELAATTGLQIDPRRIQRLVQKVGPAFRKLQTTLPQQEEKVPRMYVLADGTGIPMRPDVLKGRKGKQPDGSAKTQEVKVGCVFSEHPKAGEDPVRDPQSTTYVATMKPSDQFGPMLRAEARRRNIGAADEMVFISDAAHYFKEIARTCFPQATWILDFYHASEHLHELVNTIHNPETKKAKALASMWTRWLLNDKVDRIVTRARQLAPPDQLEEINRQLQYFEKHRDGMMYKTFSDKGFFIGSGVIEAACKTLIGKRLKQSGMFWSKDGAENILAFRSSIFSKNYDHIWNLNIRDQYRLAA